jgi:hypothetical protein
VSVLEQLTVPGISELPQCRCGKLMRVANTNPLPERIDTHVRLYDCPACHHEMRLTVWGADMLSWGASVCG